MFDLQDPLPRSHDDDHPERQRGLTPDENTIIEKAVAILRGRAHDAIAMTSWSMLTEYLALNAANERAEALRVLFLDRNNKLIRDQVMSRGTVDHVPVYVREIIRAAILLDASAMILSHNHPSGDPSPSS